ncbi:hypothetical protein BSP99_02185 [Corynebacterium glutamicum]|uniref:glycosyltransferase family 25 protein n=1 Tax=Corynebacterium glutamicum TaxID=1718 RepID=UPI00094A184E|nr:glycosyltransferase family 25 protein [Corynebacterium glutamicum]APT06397.1 hypothetical protein BSP99_02185 [Corynebacterium glutamicum]
MSETKLSSLSEDWKIFQRKIRARTKAVNWADPQFLREAEALYAFYRRATGQELRRVDHTLVSYLELIRQDWGLQAVESEVKNLLQAGAVPKTLATAAQYSARAGKDLSAAVRMTDLVYQVHRDDPITNLVMGQAHAAVGDWSGLDEVAKTALQAKTITPWSGSRWARLLVDNCRFDVATDYIGYLEDNNLPTSLLNERINSFASATESFDVPTYLINLESEPRKLDLSLQLLAWGGYQPERIKAVDGRELPSFAHEILGSSPDVYREQGAGAIATALSHIGIWERFLAGHDSHCLVVEDDAAPYVHWTYHRENIQHVAGYDLVWGNERMSRTLGAEKLPEAGLSTPWEILAGRPSAFRGIGTDCYLISRAGATRLLELFSEHSIRGHIDGQMGAYSIGDQTEKAQNRTQSTTQNLRRSMEVTDGVSSVCFNIPAIFANDHGVSNTLEISRDHRESLGR